MVSKTEPNPCFSSILRAPSKGPIEGTRPALGGFDLSFDLDMRRRGQTITLTTDVLHQVFHRGGSQISDQPLNGRPHRRLRGQVQIDLQHIDRHNPPCSLAKRRISRQAPPDRCTL